MSTLSNKTSRQILDEIPDESYFIINDPDEKGRVSCTFLAFNTIVTLLTYAPKATAEKAFDAARKACRVYERLFSRTLPHSDITRINNAAGTPVVIDAYTYDLLTQALYYCKESEGTFDITVGPLVKLWDFHQGKIADETALLEAAQHVDWKALKLWREPHTAQENAPQCPTATYYAQLIDPTACIDVGGIAKGWIADNLGKLLTEKALSIFFINLGGNILVHGTKPDNTPWSIGVRNPQNPQQLLYNTTITYGSAVTSGVYERCFTSNGTRFHHILNPQTGLPVTTDTESVTVITEKSIDAEGFSTSLLALGIEDGCALVKKHPEIIQAFFVDKENTIYPVYS